MYNVSSTGNSRRHSDDIAVSNRYFKIVRLPGRGEGWVATRNIPAGRVIYRCPWKFARSAVPSVQSRVRKAPHRKLDDLLAEHDEDRSRDLARKILSRPDRYGTPDSWYCAPKQLRDARHERRDPRYPRESWTRALAYIATNAYGDDGEALALYGRPVDKINHSCWPNVTLPDRNGHVHVVTIQEIRTGEEICVSYIHTDQTIERRHRATRRSWEFTCLCSRCRAAGPDSALLADSILLQQAECSDRVYRLHLQMHRDLSKLIRTADTPRHLWTILQLIWDFKLSDPQLALVHSIERILFDRLAGLNARWWGRLELEVLLDWLVEHIQLNRFLHPKLESTKREPLECLRRVTRQLGWRQQKVNRLVRMLDPHLLEVERLFERYDN